MHRRESDFDAGNDYKVSESKKLVYPQRIGRQWEKIDRPSLALSW